MNKDNENENKDVKKLLMSILVAQGVSSVTLSKILGIVQGSVSKTIPVSDIQKDVKRYEQNLRQKATQETSRKAKQV